MRYPHDHLLGKARQQVVMADVRAETKGGLACFAEHECAIVTHAGSVLADERVPFEGAFPLILTAADRGLASEVFLTASRFGLEGGFVFKRIAFVFTGERCVPFPFRIFCGNTFEWATRAVFAIIPGPLPGFGFLSSQKWAACQNEQGSQNDCFHILHLRDLERGHPQLILLIKPLWPRKFQSNLTYFSNFFVQILVHLFNHLISR